MKEVKIYSLEDALKIMENLENEDTTLEEELAKVTPVKVG